jgi:hypothetical protein
MYEKAILMLEEGVKITGRKDLRDRLKKFKKNKRRFNQLMVKDNIYAEGKTGDSKV